MTLICRKGGNIMILSNTINSQAPMRLRLEIRKKCNFFWLRDIHGVDITQCCAKCFIGGKDNRVYYGTLHKTQAVVDIEIEQHVKTKAYYLCGLSAGFIRNLNTHVAFIPENKSEIRIENDRIKLIITNAKRIHFWDYTPKPRGVFTEQQRRCRNWIFANYLKEKMYI